MTSNWPWALICEEPLKQSITIKRDCLVTCLEAVRSFWSIKTHGCVNHMRKSNIGLVYIWYWDPFQVIGVKWSEIDFFTSCSYMCVIGFWGEVVTSCGRICKTCNIGRVMSPIGHVTCCMYVLLSHLLLLSRAPWRRLLIGFQLMLIIHQ